MPWLAIAWVLQAPVARAADAAPLVARIESRYATVDTLTASFTQTVHSPVYGDDVQAGTLAIQRPGKMRWEFAGDGRLFLSDGQTTWMYTPESKQALKYPYVATGANGLLQSLDRVGELFNVTAPDPQPTDGGVVVDLVPKTNDGAIAKVRLALAADLSLREVELTDPVGTRTTLAFTAVKLGTVVPPSTFLFTPPPGTAVIDGAL